MDPGPSSVLTIEELSASLGSQSRRSTNLFEAGECLHRRWNAIGGSGAAIGRWLEERRGDEPTGTKDA